VTNPDREWRVNGHRKQFESQLVARSIKQYMNVFSFKASIQEKHQREL
jgi:hypothetical protein